MTWRIALLAHIFPLLSVIGSAQNSACPETILASESCASDRSKDVILANYREGLLGLVKGQYDAAVFHLQAAESDLARLRPKSIREGAASWVVNDRKKTYLGEDFEQAYINYFLAIAFLQRGELEEAMVEARRLNETLKELNRIYGAENRRYGVDPALMILSGMLYEAQGKTNDAFIDYRNAFLEYRARYASLTSVAPPGFIVQAIRDLGQALGFQDEISQLDLDRLVHEEPKPVTSSVTTLNATPSGRASLFDSEPAEMTSSYGSLFRDSSSQAAVEPTRPGRSAMPQATSGQVMVLIELGHIGIKVEQVLTIPIPPGVAGGGDLIRLKFPKYVRRDYDIVGARIRLHSLGLVACEPISNLDQLAHICLDDKISRIRRKTVARAVAKHAGAAVIEHQIAENNSGIESVVAGWLLKAAANASEKADTRSVTELPAMIVATRCSLPPGIHEAQLEYLSQSGVVLQQESLQLDIGAGHTTFIWRRACL